MNTPRTFFLLSLLFSASVLLGMSHRTADAAGFCGGVRVDCDTGHVEPASKIVIPVTQVTGAVGTATLSNYQTTAGMTNYASATHTHTITDVSGAISTVTLTNYQTTAGMTNYASATHTHTVTDVSGAVSTATLTNYVPWSELTSTATSSSTTGDVSTNRHGLVPRAPNDATKCLVGDGTWTTCPGGGSGLAFTTVYSVDYSTLAAQNLLTGGNGNKTIDGKTCSLFRSENLQTAYLNDGTHAGLYLRSNANNTSLTAGNDGGLACNVGNLAASVSLNSLASVLEWWAWVMVSTPHVPNAATESANVGFYWGNAGQPLFYLRTVYTSSLAYGAALARYNDVATSLSGSSTSADVYAFRFHGGEVEAYSGSSSSGAFPARSALTYNTRVAIGPPVTLANGIILFTSDGHRLVFSVATGNTAAAADLLVKKLLIEVR